MSTHPVIPMDDGLDAARGRRPTSAETDDRGPRVATLSRLLRGIGAVALLASASTFLVQRWEAGGDLERYFTLLAHPAVLALLGVYCGTRGRDTKAARTFVALAAAFVPVLGCVLGGLVYSQFAWDGAASGLPGYATWVASGPGAAMLALAVTALVAVPVVLFSFVTLGRSRATALSAAYLVSNALLLLPTRDPTAVALLATLNIAALGVWEWKALSRDAALRTLEGVFVRVMLMVPAALVLLRNALHYEVSYAFFALIWGSVAVGWLAVAAMAKLPEVLKGVLRSACLVSLFLAAGCASAAAGSVGMSETFAIPFAALGFAVSAGGLSIFAGREAWGDSFRHLALVVALGGMVVDLLHSPDVFTSGGLFLSAVATLSYGYLSERKALFLAGVAGVLFALAYHVRYAAMLYAYTRWGSLALLGVLVIVAAGYLERNGDKTLEWVHGFRAHLATFR
jgi:hypothetical protein